MTSILLDDYGENYGTLPSVQHNIKWVGLPFVISCITVGFYAVLNLFEGSSIIDLIPIYLVCVLFTCLLIGASICLIPALGDPRFIHSTCCIWLLALSRALDSLAAIVPHLKHNTILRITIGQPPIALQSWILFATFREYFSTALAHRDPQNYVPPQHELASVTEVQSTLSFTEAQTPSRAGWMKLELLCLVTLTVCIFAQEITLLFHPKKSIVFKDVLDELTTVLTWSMLILEAGYIVLKIAQMQYLAEMGIFFSKSHSNGFVWFILLSGYAACWIIDLVFQITQSGVNSSPDFDSQVYYTFGREILTRFLPYSFHLFNIFQLKRYSGDRGKSESIDASLRIKILCYLVIAIMHVVGVGNVYEVAAVLAKNNCKVSYLYRAARSAGIIATIDFCCVCLAIVAPLAQFLTYFYNITRYSVHRLHFHRNMAWSACIFAALHVILHLVNWMDDDYTRTSCPPQPSNCTNGTYPLPTSLPTPTPTPFPVGKLSLFFDFNVITGAPMVVCFFIAFISGIIMTRKRSGLFFFSLHVPVSFAGFLIIYIHGDHILGANPGTQMFKATFIFAIVVATLYFLFARIRELEVDPKSAYGSSYIILSIKYRNSHIVPPAAFFNIYASADSYASIFHSHSFPVFSTRNSRIVFLIKQRPLDPNSRGTSFTARLASDRPSIIKVQGPFNGPASSFLLSLNSAKNIRADKCIFMCGWNAGFASVFNLLEYFKDHGRLFNLQSVTCMFAEISDENVRSEIHRYVNELVGEWNSFIPLTIIESDSARRLVAMTDAHDVLFEQGMDLGKWQEIFPDCKIWFAEKSNGLGERRIARVSDTKILYFCGNGFNYQQFPEPKWQTFVESS